VSACLQENFDDVVRRRVQEPTAYLPSRLLDVKNTASERSLAEIYADEFAVERARAAGADIPVPEIDAKLQKEHDLISSVFDEVCDKLDALSNARFTPRAAQTQITSISNAPSVSLESALPTGASTSTLLAPEEIFAPQQRGTLTSKAEMTPSQKKAERLRARKAKQVTMQAIQKYGGNGGGKSASKQKDRAMNSLIGKRGVTVIGKGKTAKSALTGRDRKERVNDANGPSSANAFKL
jgi:U3 small nucleolar RNA-associated protein MPP10